MSESYRVILTNRALSDLEDISAFIAQDSPQIADAVAQMIVEGIDSLGSMPTRFRQAGHSRKRGATVRAMVVYPFIVYYHINEGEKALIVLHVIHGARKQPRRFE